MGESLRGDVFGNHGVSRSERAGSDSAELMHGHSAADESAVADLDVSTEHAAIGEDHRFA